MSWKWEDRLSGPSSAERLCLAIESGLKPSHCRDGSNEGPWGLGYCGDGLKMLANGTLKFFSDIDVNKRNYKNSIYYARQIYCHGEGKGGKEGGGEKRREQNRREEKRGGGGGEKQRETVSGNAPFTYIQNYHYYYYYHCQPAFL